MSSATNTLRRRLLRLLWWPLLSVLVLAAAFEYGRALERARDEQDLALRRVAIALASRLDLDADDMLDDDIGAHLDRTFAAMQQLSVQDHLAYLVLAQPGRSLAGEIALQGYAVAGASEQPVFADHRRGADDLRVISYPHASRAGLVQIVVAETTRRRDAQARQVLVDTLVPNALLMALAQMDSTREGKWRHRLMLPGKLGTVEQRPEQVFHDAAAFFTFGSGQGGPQCGLFLWRWMTCQTNQETGVETGIIVGGHRRDSARGAEQSRLGPFRGKLAVHP